MYGQLHCLKYLHENRCPWDEYACALAAGSGQLACLKYLHENGCPWDRRACESAAQYGRRDCLEYVHKNGCPCKHNRPKLEIYSTDLDIKIKQDN
jgi:hypothetical protein